MIHVHTMLNYPLLWTRMFITAFTRAQYLSVFWARSIQSTHTHPVSWRSNLILSSHLSLVLQSGLFPSGVPTEALYASLPSPIRATCLSHLILLDLIIRTKFDDENRSLFSFLIRRDIRNTYSANGPKQNKSRKFAYEVLVDAVENGKLGHDSEFARVVCYSRWFKWHYVSFIDLLHWSQMNRYLGQIIISGREGGVLSVLMEETWGKETSWKTQT